MNKVGFERKVRRPIVASILAMIYEWIGWKVEIAYVLDPVAIISGSHVAVRCSKKEK